MALIPEQFTRRKAYTLYLRGFSLFFLLVGVIVLIVGGQWPGLIFLATGAVMALAWLPAFTRQIMG
jgi:hypothetical protein